MVVSASHFKEITNGYEKRTDGLWTHSGKLGVSGTLQVTGGNTVASGVGSYTPHLDLYNADPATTGAGAFIRLRGASGWSTTLGMITGLWWHLFTDSTGNGTATGGGWGYDGTRLRRADDTAWRTPVYSNGYNNYGAPWTPGYRKMPDGTVRMHGLLACGTQGTSAFTLPAGFRPGVGMAYMFLCAHQGGILRTDVSETGTVQVGVEVKAGNWIPAGWASINEISFLAEQ